MSTEKNFQKIIELMGRDESVDAPADSVRWASNLFRTRAVESKPSLIKKLAAVFQMEIAPNKPALGERSAATSTVRQILYSAGDNAIDIRIERTKKGFSVHGQILGTDFADASVRMAGESKTFEASVDGAGEFRLESIPAGTYEITIHNAAVEITLKAFDIS
jgi:hypothetical protein